MRQAEETSQAAQQAASQIRCVITLIWRFSRGSGSGSNSRLADGVGLFFRGSALAAGAVDALQVGWFAAVRPGDSPLHRLARQYPGPEIAPRTAPGECPARPRLLV